jgi:hypothetical protein
MIKTMVKVLTASGYTWVKNEAVVKPIKKVSSERRKVSQLTGVIVAK